MSLVRVCYFPLSYMPVNRMSSGFEPPFTWNKQLEDVTMGFVNLWRTFFNISWRFTGKTTNGSIEKIIDRFIDSESGRNTVNLCLSSKQSPCATTVNWEHSNAAAFDWLHIAHQSQGFSQGALKHLVVPVASPLSQQCDSGFLLETETNL